MTWTERGEAQYVVTESVASAALVYAILVSGHPDARFESWSDYPYDQESGTYKADVSRETLKGT